MGMTRAASAGAPAGRRPPLFPPEASILAPARAGGRPLPHVHARAVDLDAVQGRVRPREVEELEDAVRAAGRLRHGLPRVDAGLVDDDELAGRDLPLERRADEVERARLGRDDPVV